VTLPDKWRRVHLRLVLDACNYARQPKTLRGLTRYDVVCTTWAEQAERFMRDPTDDTVGRHS
jgi:hypothetical protein